MQLTKFDRWLKERFIYETHLVTLRLPEKKLPRGVRIEDLEVIKAGDYRYKLIIKDNDLAQEVIETLKENRLMYSTQVVESKNWYNKRIAPKGKSFTLRWISRFINLIIICFVAWVFYLLISNPSVVTAVKASMKEFNL